MAGGVSTGPGAVAPRKESELRGNGLQVFVTLLTCGVMSFTAQAQDKPEVDKIATPIFSIKHDATDVVRRFPKDQFAILTSPAHISEKPHAWRYLVPLAAGLAFIPLDRHLSANLPKGHGGISATIANIGLDGTAATAGAFYFTGMARHDDHERDRPRVVAQLRQHPPGRRHRPPPAHDRSINATNASSRSR